MPSFLTPGSLSQAIDDHIAWLTDWHRLAFLEISSRTEQAKNLAPPASFNAWYESALKSLPQDQPSIDRLATLHDQLHQLAKLVLMKTPEGQPVARVEYEDVIAKHNELIQGLRRLERAFSVAASGLDLLTGLRSRVGLLEDLGREYSRFMRNGRPFCITMIDIDHFKAVNDTYGHDAGDRVLASVADFISRTFRPFDDAYRLGGEEFLVCLKEIDLATGLKVLERVRGNLEKMPIALMNGPAITITASFGLVMSVDDIAVEDMLHRADQALYRAKNQGRNRIVVLDSSAG
jgi:diguanylate cyclase (GGDEF)-like protein